MPAETALVVGLIATAFVFFAAILIYGDMTWEKK